MMEAMLKSKPYVPYSMKHCDAPLLSDWVPKAYGKVHAVRKYPPPPNDSGELRILQSEIKHPLSLADHL